MTVEELDPDVERQIASLDFLLRLAAVAHGERDPWVYIVDTILDLRLAVAGAVC